MFKRKMMLPILAVMAGVAATAFTTISNHQQTQADNAYYWFEYNEDGSALLNQMSEPILKTTDPYPCDGDGVNCSQAFTSYSEVPVNGQTEYVPGDPASPAIIHQKDPE